MWLTWKHTKRGPGSFKLTVHISKILIQSSNRYACDICIKHFPHPISLKVHKSQYHTKYFDLTPEDDFKCKTCSHRAKNKQLILKHINKQHLHVTTFLCDICGKSFLTEKNLKAHIPIHNESKDYMCQICPKNFKMESGLRAHLRTHREDRRFTCNECGKAFKKNYSLLEHKKAHQGFFPFRCNACGKRFVSQAVLNSHVKRHIAPI